MYPSDVSGAVGNEAKRTGGEVMLSRQIVVCEGSVSPLDTPWIRSLPPDVPDASMVPTGDSRNTVDQSVTIFPDRR
jgi:hypothetical protein